MPVSIECPGCGTNYDIPSKAIGRKVSCKCGKTFIAESPEEPDDYRSAFDGLDEELESEPELKPLARTAPHVDLNTESTDVIPRNPWRNPPVSSAVAKRYPHLHRYLGWIVWIAKLQFGLVILVFLFSLLIAVGIVLNDRSSRSANQTVLLVECGFGIFTLLPAWIFYVAVRASVEFINVIVDIEKSNRMAAIQSGAMSEE